MDAFPPVKVLSLLKLQTVISTKLINNCIHATYIYTECSFWRERGNLFSSIGRTSCILGVAAVPR